MNTPSPISSGFVQGDDSTQSVKKRTTSFYRLTNEEWIQAVHELKPRERDVLYYIRTLDPFGDRPFEIGVRGVAKILNCDPATVSRALKVLDSKGYIDLELINVQIKVLSTHNTLSPHNTVASRSSVLSPHNSDDRHTTPTIVTQRSQSETFTEQEVQNPQTIQTIQTIQTLSPTDNLEREISEVSEEELLKFVIYKVSQDPDIKRPRIYAKGCLRDDRDFWIDEFAKWQKLRFEINVPPAPLSIDLNAVIAGIDGELARLDWSRDQAIAHMVEQFEWRKIVFDLITDNDLLILLNELEQMESEVET